MDTYKIEKIIRKVRKASPIVKVIGEYVQLTKKRIYHWGLCPFHEERTPSFSVIRKKGIYHCFGCLKGGDVFRFIMEIEDCTFFDSIEFLAKRAGIKIYPEVGGE